LTNLTFHNLPQIRRKAGETEEEIEEIEEIEDDRVRHVEKCRSDDEAMQEANGEVDTDRDVDRVNIELDLTELDDEDEVIHQVDDIGESRMEVDNDKDGKTELGTLDENSEASGGGTQVKEGEGEDLGERVKKPVNDAKPDR
jgi:hypothetical protein